MKKLPAILAAVLLSSAISATAFAANKSITVFIDQQPVTFSNSAPVQENGSVSVPFRTLFEKLGLQVTWDAKTKTIIGSKTGLDIQLKIGSKQATVNGQAMTLTVAPKAINNVTYVPLPFISEVTGNEVKWDSETQSVLITTKSNTTNTLGPDIAALFNQYASYYNEENLDGLMSLIHPSSPLAQFRDALKQQLDTYDILQSVDEVNIVSADDNEVIVHVIESAHKTKGPFLLDNTAELIYSLVKDEAETSWRLYNYQVQSIHYHLPEDALTAEVKVPQADADQILAVLNDNLKYTNEENLDAVISTIGGTDALLKQTKEVYKQLFAAYDLAFTLDKTKIIHYGDGEAAIYTVQTTKKVKGPEFQDHTSEVVHTIKKDADGKWKITQSSVISVEPLNS